MNILFILYGDFNTNSANPVVQFSEQLHHMGHECVIAVPHNLQSVQNHQNICFKSILFNEALTDPFEVFFNKKPADIIHACTPRENVRHFIFKYQLICPTPFVIYFEDNERYILSRYMKDLFAHIPQNCSHPFFHDYFCGLADGIILIQPKLEIFVPPWVHFETIMIGTDLNQFSPRKKNLDWLKKLSIKPNEKVIVYHGGLNEFTKSSLKSLIEAIEIINRTGIICKLIRSGPYQIDFWDKIDQNTIPYIIEVGLIKKSDLPNLLSISDLFVQPGKIDEFEDYRLPSKIIEFFAMGKPVILPRVNISKFLDNYHNAIILNEGSPLEIATRCIEVLNNPILAKSLGNNARLFSEKYFDIKKQTIHLESLYKKIIENYHSDDSKQIWEAADINKPSQVLLKKLKLISDHYLLKQENLHEKKWLDYYINYVHLIEMHIFFMEKKLRYFKKFSKFITVLRWLKSKMKTFKNKFIIRKKN